MGPCLSQTLPPVENPQLEVDRINNEILEESKLIEESNIPKIFNREKEQAFILNILEKPPHINAIVGPPNCGKTTLLNYLFLRLHFEKKIHLIKWNFRFTFFLFF